MSVRKPKVCDYMAQCPVQPCVSAAAAAAAAQGAWLCLT